MWQDLIELVPSLPRKAEKILANPRKASRYRQDFTKEEYTQLGTQYVLNARQIKNSIVLARALARERGTLLAMSAMHRAVTAVAGQGGEGGSSSETLKDVRENDSNKIAVAILFEVGYNGFACNLSVVKGTPAGVCWCW